MSAQDPKHFLHEIESELRRLGLLSGPIQPAQVVRTAFGSGEMPFEDWLVKVFLPRAYEAAETNAWPSNSQVGIAAIRNFDGLDEYGPLVDLLCEFDQAVVAHHQSKGAAGNAA